MSYIQSALSEGEELIKEFQLHWMAYIPAWLWVTAGAICLGVAVNYALIGLVGTAIFCGIGIYQGLQLYFLEMAVTDKRVILKTGVISRHTEELQLKALETCELRQSISGRLFNYGKIEITGKGVSDVIFKSVDDPMVVKRTIDSAAHQYESV